MKPRYSNCKCGETAFDGNYQYILENEKVVMRFQYRCRNCLRLLNTKLNESDKPMFNIHTMKEVREYTC